MQCIISAYTPAHADLMHCIKSALQKVMQCINGASAEIMRCIKFALQKLCGAMQIK